MGELASSDNYDAVDWSRMNQPFGELSDPNPVLHSAAGGLVQIRPSDIDAATAAAMGASGGGMSTKAMGGILGPARKTFTDEGLPIAGGGYTKRAREVLDEIAAGQKGAGPMDMSMSAMTPDVPQVAMDRLVPPRGVSPRLQDALQNQDMVKGVRESIERGIGLGADKWYHNEPVRQAFLKELGKEEGPKAYTQFMDHVAATSPRSDVPTNIRNASFQYQHARKGQDLPDKLPYPYGHVAQNLHRQNFDMLTAPQPGNLSSASTPHDFGRWDIYQNPKPASFSQNLQGNLEPGTMDTHAFRNIGMRTGDPRFMETSVSAKYKAGSDPGKDTIVAKYGEWTKPDTVAFRPQRLHKEGRLPLEEAQKIPYFWAAKPNPNEYGAAEQLYKRLGQERGLPTADAQAAAWAGGGDVTGLGTSAVHTFPEMMNERILFTAKMRGEDPKKTLSDFIRGNRPLLSIGGAAGGMGAIAAQDRYQPGE
jgi:hypothetical protein